MNLFATIGLFFLGIFARLTIFTIWLLVFIGATLALVIYVIFGGHLSRRGEAVW